MFLRILTEDKVIVRKVDKDLLLPACSSECVNAAASRQTVVCRTADLQHIGSSVLRANTILQNQGLSSVAMETQKRKETIAARTR